MKGILLMIGIVVSSIFGVIIISGALFFSCSPAVGKAPTRNQKAAYGHLENFKNGEFQNLHPSPMEVNYFRIIKEVLKGGPNRKPERNIEVENIDSISIENSNPNTTQLIWLGHSSFLLLIDGKKFLIDPIFSQRPSPISFVGAKRYSNNMPIEIENLPFIDGVIISHDHYDHLDYKTILAIKDKVGRFYIPLGVGIHLNYWGVTTDKITELNWWQSEFLDSIQLVCTPARHMSGRGLFGGSTTLWCSWVIVGTNEKVFFSGDGGYDMHFKKIGDKYGPFDVSLLECGQYDEDWKLLHMMPEQSVQAAFDLKSKLSVPMHWGAFTSAFHDWTEPIERMSNEAEKRNLRITTPRIGEPILVGDTAYPQTKWWLDYK